MTHDKTELYEGNHLNVAREMEQTRVTLLEAAGMDSKLTRIPYGSHPYMTETFRDGLVQQNMKMRDWNVDTMDWKYHVSNPRIIFEKTIKGLNEIRTMDQPIVGFRMVNKTKSKATFYR